MISQLGISHMHLLIKFICKNSAVFIIAGVHPWFSDRESEYFKNEVWGAAPETVVVCFLKTTKSYRHNVAS